MQFEHPQNAKMARMKNSAFLSIRHFSIIFKKKEAGKKVHAEDCERKIAQADCKICEFLLCKNSVASRRLA